MNACVKNQRLVVALSGRVDSTNYRQVEDEIRQAMAEYPGLPLTLDAEALSYISSSGLRVIMKLVKDGCSDLTVQNASAEVYDVFHITGISTVVNVEKRMRRVDVTGCPVIGEGAFGTVYRLDGDTIVKVYRNGEDSLPIIRQETARARQAFILGVPTAIPFDIVRVGDEYGSVFEMIDAQNCNDIVRADPAALDDLIPRYAALIKQLHSIEIEPGQLPQTRDIYLEHLSAFAPCLDADTVARLTRLLKAMPQDLHLVHGDIQMKNLMLSSGVFTLIDMDKISAGNPGFEFASLYACYVAFNEHDPDNAMQFFGIDAATTTRIYRDTLRAYLGGADEDALRLAERKVQVAGYLRFLTILMLEMKDDHSPLKETRVRCAAERLRTLAFQVEDLLL